jgi:single-strand selective monofunctional uracil DNA glycosylase
MPMDLIAVAKRLSTELRGMSFSPPVTHVYAPLDYAWAPHRRYLERYGTTKGRTLFLGMNPGPWGMVQTGVPFGDVHIVRDWLQITEPVRKPEREHPRRPVLGFDCPRREASGRRFWGWARANFGSPEQFFAQFFVLNYCPLCFLEATGRNRTPDRLPAPERRALFERCDAALKDSVSYLEPAHVIGVGRFAAARAAAALSGEVRVSTITHPSPANPRANRGWAQALETLLESLSLPVRAPR